MPQKKVEKLTDAQLNTEMLGRRNELKSLHDEMEPIQDKIAWRCKRLKVIQSEQDKRAIKKMKKRIDWPWLLHVALDDSEEKYRARDEALRAIHLECSVFWPDTEQANVGLYIQQKDDISDHMKGVRKILRHIKERDKYKRFSILDHTCSEYGALELAVKPDGSLFKVLRTTYGRTACLQKEKTLKKILKYIQDYHYA